MTKLPGTVTLLATLLASLTAVAHDTAPLTVAVFGDWPYNKILLDSANLLIDSVNADHDIRFVMHVGDDHSGSMPCTGAGLAPLPAGAKPNWNRDIFKLFEQFDKPFVYTPGDNEWTDCHKKSELSSGAPLNELANVRQVFFAKPGLTLGKHTMPVQTQAENFDRTYPSDAQFVENLMWQDGHVVFLTLNLPGSNNDGMTWEAPFTDEPARTREAAQRTGADIRWLQRAFAQAEKTHAKAVVIGTQADMWDFKGMQTGEETLSDYTFFVHELASLCLHFGRPVLLINGDSHVYGADHPLADPASPTGRIHNTPPVPNLTRITVQGSTSTPGEWLRLTIAPDKVEPFSWKNVVYCQAPKTSCE
jgi:hypothetical protein